nr:unnamed protein product [Salmo salar]|eukprot:XP_014030712.1 PREDICTED: uncharacterized protein LOC106587156 [Salmo salar]
MQYLQTMTSQSPEQDRLNALNRMLDPECQDPAISRAKFQSTMREWIAQCSQDGMHEDDKHISGENPCKVSINGMDFSGPEIKTAFSEGEQCYCDSRELLAIVSELKYAHSRMSKQNNSLLRTVSQGEDTNLQLTVEITELSAKLASAQRSARRTRSLVEELEDARRSLREAQERASQAQASSCKLEELEETLVMVAVRDRELTKKDILMDKLKNSHLENHRIIEGLQSEFMHLSEHSQQALLRFDRHCGSPPGFQGRSGVVPYHHSLHAEIQDIQQRGVLEEMTGPVCGVRSSHTQRDDIQNIIHRIKSAELAHLLHAHYPERGLMSVQSLRTLLVVVLLRPWRGHIPTASSHSLASSSSWLMCILKELELQTTLWEEREENVAEQRRLREQQEQKQKPQAKREAVVNWWRTLKVDGSRTNVKPEDTLTQPSKALTDAESKLQQAKHTITKIREQVRHLELALKTAQEGVAEHKNIQDRVGVLHKDKETNTRVYW